MEDVEKRSEYRKAHGLDKDEGFGGWTAKTNDELLGPAVPVQEVNDEARASQSRGQSRLSGSGLGFGSLHLPELSGIVTGCRIRND